MDNELIFKALSCPTRIKILEKILSKEIHLSGIAKEIGISKPVTSKHLKILEDANLLKKRVIGNIHLYSSKIQNIEKLFDPLVEKSSITVNKNISLFEVLKQIPNIKIKKVGNHQYITSIGNEEGYYLYEIDKNLPKKPIDDYKIHKNITLDLKKLVTIKKKKIKIKIKEN